MPTDTSSDVLAFRMRVMRWITTVTAKITACAFVLDESKLHSPEKEILDASGQYDYNEADPSEMSAISEAIQHHYENNPHHPEYYDDGVNEMTLVDIVVMFCDWLGNYEVDGEPIDIGRYESMYGIAPQLCEIFRNTLDELGVQYK